MEIYTMRKLNRIKKQKRKFDKEHFYIHKCDNGIYQFRDRQSHMVISTASDISTLKRSITIVINRYKNYDYYLSAISSMSESTVTEKDFALREKEWKRGGQKYTYILEDIISEYQLEQEEKEDFRHRRVILPVAPVEKPVEVESSPKPLGHIKLSKKKRSRL